MHFSLRIVYLFVLITPHFPTCHYQPSYDITQTRWGVFMFSPYEPKVGTTDYEILELLRKLCPDFAPYNYLKDIDLYKGSLLGGSNVYFKNGINRTKGMVTTKSNIKLYDLNRYPYNFQTISNHNDKSELGWSGSVLLTLLKDLYKKSLTIQKRRFYA